MTPARPVVTELVKMIGHESISTPYHSHNKTPLVKIKNMASDTSSADRRRQIRTSCGTNATVVNVPAKNPISPVHSVTRPSVPWDVVGHMARLCGSRAV